MSVEALKNWRGTAEKVAEAARRLRNVQVVVFGSIVEDKFTASSDIDILIMSEDIPKGAIKRAWLKKAIEERAGLPPIHPVEIHLATKKEAEANPIYLEALRKGTAI